ncbi:hypothetical protein BC940DRAFT_306760 [Gongronella butleri]|nr:hypothetical protein BC940DRAFT_306760 [Gongronella butleri]
MLAFLPIFLLFCTFLSRLFVFLALLPRMFLKQCLRASVRRSCLQSSWGPQKYAAIARPRLWDRSNRAISTCFYSTKSATDSKTSKPHEHAVETAQAQLARAARDGEWHLAQDVYDASFRYEEKTGMDTFALLMEAYLRGGRLQDAMDIYYSLREHMDRHERSKLKMDEQIYTRLIAATLDAAANEHKNDELSPHLGYTVDDLDFDAAAVHHEHLDLDTSASLAFAMRLFQDMHNSPHSTVSSDVYLLLLNACRTQRDSFILHQVHRYLRMDDAVDMDHALVAALMHAYLAVNDHTLFLELCDTYALTSPALANLALQFCIDNRYAHTAMRLWDQLPRSMQHDPQFSQFFIDRLIKAKLVDEATHILAATSHAPSLAPLLHSPSSSASS